MLHIARDVGHDLLRREDDPGMNGPVVLDECIVADIRAAAHEREHLVAFARAVDDHVGIGLHDGATRRVDEVRLIGADMFHIGRGLGEQAFLVAVILAQPGFHDAVELGNRHAVGRRVQRVVLDIPLGEVPIPGHPGDERPVTLAPVGLELGAAHALFRRRDDKTLSHSFLRVADPAPQSRAGMRVKRSLAGASASTIDDHRLTV